MKKINLFFFACCAALLTACGGTSDYSPKPKGFFRIIYPEKKYKLFTETAPYSFEYPVYSQVLADQERNAGQYWYNLAFPQFNGRLHLTYYQISSIKDYEMMVEDARKLAFKHTVKASAIDQKRINYPDHKVYGVYYEIDGNTASSVQFFLTDSVSNYFRGALYFNERPQYDSIAPVISFIKKDIDRLISTFTWKNHQAASKKVSPKTFILPKPNQPALGKIAEKVKEEIKIAAEPAVPAVRTGGSQYVRNVSYIADDFIPADSLQQTATKFFQLFMAGKIAEAYAFFDTAFTEKVGVAQIEAVQKEWLRIYGDFSGVDNASYIKQGANEAVVLTTKFSKAKPVFAISFKGGKIIGFFKNADNFLSVVKDPEYADKSKYEEKQIFVETGSFKLPGTLTVPLEQTNFPVVILVHGSGPNDRDETLGNIKTFRDLALGLASKGIASIRYDKRTMVYGLKSAAPGEQLTVKEETVDDALSAIKLAAGIQGADKNKIFLLGHSLGAMMAPQIANMTKDLAGVITLGNPARKFADLLQDQYPYLFSLQPQSDENTKQLAGLMAETEMIRHADTIKNKNTVIMGASAYYWQYVNAYDQVAEAKKLKLPLLIMQGEKDFNVSMKDYTIWNAALKGRKNVVFIAYPKLNHGFIETEAPMGRPADYQQQANVPGYVINDLAAFILKK